MRIFLQTVIATIALSITPGVLLHFDVTPKVVALLAGTAVSLLFFRKNVACIKSFVRTKSGLWFSGILFGHLFWSVVVTALSSSPDLSSYGGVWRRFGLITFAALVVFTFLFAAQMANSPSVLPSGLRAIVVSGLVLSIYGVCQYMGFDPVLTVQTYRAGQGPFQIVRPPGTFGHADYFATWLVFVAFSGVAVWRTDTARWMRTLGVVTVGAAVFAIILTGTRAALLGLVAGAIVLAVYRVIPPKTFATGFTFGLVLLLIFIISPIGTKARARIHWSGDDVHGGARLLIWRDSLTMARANLLTGFGPETFSLRFPQFESAELSRAYPDFYHESSHNILLDELTAKGLPGLLLLLATVVAVLWVPLVGRRNDLLAGCLSATFISLFMCQQFSVFVVSTAFAFYLSAAMLVARITAPLVIRKADERYVLWFVVPALALSACFTIYAIRLTAGDYEMARADSFVKSANPISAERELSSADRWLPPGPTDDLYFSRTMAALALKSSVALTQTVAWREALNHAIRAVKTSEDRQNAWYSLASLLARQNDFVGVERSLRNAIAWAPNWFKPHWTLAQLLQISGRRSEALTEARRAVELDGGRDADVNLTFLALTGVSPQAR